MEQVEKSASQSAEDEAVIKYREFIVRLEALLEEYGASIGGCGCCGSPWLDIGGECFERFM